MLFPCRFFHNQDKVLRHTVYTTTKRQNKSSIYFGSAATLAKVIILWCDQSFLWNEFLTPSPPPCLPLMKWRDPKTSQSSCPPHPPSAPLVSPPWLLITAVLWALHSPSHSSIKGPESHFPNQGSSDVWLLVGLFNVRVWEDKVTLMHASKLQCVINSGRVASSCCFLYDDEVFVLLPVFDLLYELLCFRRGVLRGSGSR